MTFTVIKRDADGNVMLTYEGDVIERGAHHVVVQALFQGESRNLGFMMLKQGDLFTEWFYDNRWYNVFRVHDRDTGSLKGYYCNLTRPAEIGSEQVAADDLELDVFVLPDGNTLLLDKDEYAELDLDADERAAVDVAVEDIHRRVAQRSIPFDALPAAGSSDDDDK